MTPVDVDPCLSAEVGVARPADEIFSTDSTRPTVSLTFDDGPSRENTPRILDVLEHYGVHATFFVLGGRAERMPDLVVRIDAAGHDVGNHSWSHPSFRSLWHSQIRDELCRTGALIEDQIGKRPGLFRPPFGRYAPSAIPLVGALGYDMVLWTIDSLDWGENDPSIIARRVVADAEAGSVVLLHDRRSVTVHALPQIIEGLQARGFAITSVSAALSVSPYGARG